MFCLWGPVSLTRERQGAVVPSMTVGYRQASRSGVAPQVEAYPADRTDEVHIQSEQLGVRLP